MLVMRQLWPYVGHFPMQGCFYPHVYVLMMSGTCYGLKCPRGYPMEYNNGMWSPKALGPPIYEDDSLS